MEPTSLYHSAITPSILKLIVKKLAPTASINFCQTGQFGKFYVEKYRKETLAKFEEYAREIRQCQENHPWVKEYKEILDATTAANQFVTEAEELVNELFTNEERTYGEIIELVQPLIQKGKILMDYSKHRVEIQNDECY